MAKTALITGITGQDGAYLAEFLLAKGYSVHGIKRRASSFNTDRIDHLYQDPHEKDVRLKLHYGDLTDSTNLIRIIQEVQPDEIYNLAAQSHVAVSFETPEYTANSDAVGTLRVLEAIRILGLEKKTRFYQASTSEMFGKVQEIPQRETTPFYPRSPYGAAKVYAYWITVNYREAYGMYACNGILFNHESPMRGETFVSRKITRALTRIKVGLQETLHLGNLDSRRDWGHARDYVRAQWLMLQQDEPEDFVIATGKQYSVRDFVVAAGVIARYENRVARRGRGRSGNRRRHRPHARARRSALLPADGSRNPVGRSHQGAAKSSAGRPRSAFPELVAEMVAVGSGGGQARCLGRERRLQSLQPPRVSPSDANATIANLRRRPPRVGGFGHSAGASSSGAMHNLVLRTHAGARSDRPGRVRQFFRGRAPGGRHHGRRPGGRHSRQQFPSGAVHSRQSPDPGQRDRCGLSLGRRQVRVSGFELHLSQARPAAHQGGLSC